MRASHIVDSGPPRRPALLRGLGVLGVLFALLVLTAVSASAGFDECHNGVFGTGPCVWSGGIASGANSSYSTGDAIPMRATVTAATCGVSQMVSFTRDNPPYTKLVKYTSSEPFAANNLCSGTGVTCSGAGGTDPIFTIYNGTIDSVVPAGDTHQVWFTPSCVGSNDVVLAFGAFIGAAPSANQHVCVSGTGGGCMQAKGSAFLIPPAIKIIKTMAPVTAYTFGFDRDKNGTADFQLPSGGEYIINFSSLNTGTAYNFREVVNPAGTYQFKSVSCQATSGGSFTYLDPATPLSSRVGEVDISFSSLGAIVTCTYVNVQSTAVRLAGFSGRGVGLGQVRLEWQTGTETNNAGFNILRATSPAGPYVKINPQLIGATGDAVAGASYSYVDKPGFGRYFYKLEDVDMSGKATAHDEVQAATAWPFLRLPFQPFAPAQ